MYHRYDGLIFDMDGTLLDTDATHCHAWRIVLERHDLKFDEAAMTALSGAPVWHIARAMIDRQGSDLNPHILVSEKAAIVSETILDTVQPLPLLDVVKTWYGRRPLAIGTGSERALTQALLDHLDMRKYFSAVVTADDVRCHKPAPDTFLRCAELLGVAADRCLVFEDADFGLQAARCAGMDAVDVRAL